jgi:hypothetical protein
MCFRIKETREGVIVFGKKYIDTFKLNSSFHYTILIHEIKHAYDYLLNKSMYINHSPKEKRLGELFALKIEAELIKYYLSGKFNLTEIEKCILQSYENNNLDFASSLIQDDSSEVFTFFNKLESDYLSRNITKEKLISDLVKKGNSLLNDYHYSIDVMEKLFYSVKISTYHKYLNPIIYIICDGEKSNFEEFKINNFQIGKIFKSMDELL